MIHTLDTDSDFDISFFLGERGYVPNFFKGELWDVHITPDRSLAFLPFDTINVVFGNDPQSKVSHFFGAGKWSFVDSSTRARFFDTSVWSPYREDCPPLKKCIIAVPINKYFHSPHNQGIFGAERKHDIHTGVDLYVKGDFYFQPFLPGKIVSTGPFTGPNAGTPWWEDTHYVAVYTPELNITTVYGEVEEPNGLSLHVKRVLKKDKGLPTTMLHVECYAGNPFEDIPNFDTAIWLRDQTKPENLLDPADVIPQIRVLRMYDPSWGQPFTKR